MEIKNNKKEKVAISYKGKHFIIQDKDRTSAFDYLDPYVDVEKVIKEQLEAHVADCRYYGIPPYIGDDKELKERIEKIEKEFDEYAQH